MTGMKPFPETAPSRAGSLDGRVKVLLTLLYTLVVMAVPFGAPLPLVPLALPLAFAVGASGVRLAALGRRLLLGLPFVAFVIAIPLFMDTRPVLLEIAGASWTLTEGAVRAFAIAGKFVLALSAAVVLASTAGVPEICSALSRLGAPGAFVDATALVWRYLALVSEEGARMARAREARTSGRPPFALAWRSSGAIVGGLLRRALARSERVQAAMEARGFAGAMPALRKSRMRGLDWAVLAGGVFSSAGTLAFL